MDLYELLLYSSGYTWMSFGSGLGCWATAAQWTRARRFAALAILFASSIVSSIPLGALAFLTGQPHPDSGLVPVFMVVLSSPAFFLGDIDRPGKAIAETGELATGAWRSVRRALEPRRAAGELSFAIGPFGGLSTPEGDVRGQLSEPLSRRATQHPCQPSGKFRAAGA